MSDTESYRSELENIKSTLQNELERLSCMDHMDTKENKQELEKQVKEIDIFLQGLEPDK